MSRPINFTDTIVRKKPYVKIDGIEYEVQDGNYDGGTDLNAETFNKMQDELDQFRNLFSANLYQLNDDYRASADFVKVQPNTTYVLSSKDNNVTFDGNLIFYNTNKDQLSEKYSFKEPFTTPNECYFIKVVFANNNAPLDAELQLEEGTVATSYVPFVPDNIKQVVNGSTLWTGSLKIGESITVQDLNNFDYLEFHMLRGTDYGSTIVKTKKENKHTTGVLTYTAEDSSSFYIHFGNIYWTDANVVTFRNIIELNAYADGTSFGSQILTSSEENDEVVKIVGYRLK